MTPRDPQPAPARERRRAARLSPLAAAVGGLFVAAVALARQPLTDTAPADEGLAPPAEVLALLESGDPEKHVDGFQAWHAWRAELSSELRGRARDFITHPRFFQALADEILYDFEDPRARLSACKLLARFGGQRAFPVFLWSVSDGEFDWNADAEGSFFSRLLYQPAYIKWYFGQHGDPTVIEYLPRYRYHQEIQLIQDRWRDRPAPEKKWILLSVDDFVADLKSGDPARRRLAVRALANCGHSQARLDFDRLSPLLADSDESVRLAAARVLGVVTCPELRGPLKRIVEDDHASIELRSAALLAVVNCGKARNWTAEWIVESIPDWPAGLDNVASRALVRLCPPRDQAWGPYRDFLRNRLADARDARTRAVLERSLADIP